MSSDEPTAPTAVPESGIVGGAGADGNMNDLTSLIQGVLQQTQDRFQHMSDQIIRRIDDMTTRIDDLEKNISDLLQNNQVEQPPPTN